MRSSHIDLVQDLRSIRTWEALRDEVARGWGAITRWGGDLARDRALTDGGWDDLRGGVREGDANAVLTWQALPDKAFTRVGHMRHDQADAVTLEWQMPHGWVPGRGVQPHIHIVPTASGTGLFALDVSYFWLVIGDTMAPTVTQFADRQIVPAEYLRHLLVPLATIAPPATAGRSSVLILTAARNVARDTFQATNGTGTGAANVALLSIDAHVYVDRAGSEEP